MAEIQTGDGKGRAKNVELNLVPVIDLMSVLITFLLITAVWTQVSMIQIGSSIYGKKNNDQIPEVKPETDLVLKLDVRSFGYVLTAGTQVTQFPKKEEGYDEEGLIEALKKVKEAHPLKEDAVITMEDRLPYEQLIKSMDGVLSAGFSSISVATGGPQ